ncbi:hypothetical protein GCM10007978_00160 [Shewanella hanedai]|uniref:hypothetical protein n=1 Tax=Shewanella hanedai TaxID=25 RepID=UPI0019960005|nr:hypothetical protein [Shewanella hanedai]GGI66933.1 hypothetical protein GCM10007978_00160 [Shewanella hanedai]
MQVISSLIFSTSIFFMTLVSVQAKEVGQPIEVIKTEPTSAGQTEPAAFDAHLDKQVGEEEDPCLTQSANDTAFDNAFDYLNTKFCQPALWFDSFFVDERTQDDARAGTLVRWTNDFSNYQKEGFKYKINLNARFNLPGVNKKVKVIIDSQGEDDPFAFLKGPNNDGERDIGLRYDWYAKDRVSFNIKANFKPKLEARWRYAYPISQSTIARLTQKVYQEKKVTGESTEFDIEHSFDEDFLLRWSAVAQYENRDNGWEFGSSVNLYHYISSKQALNYIASIYGVDAPYHYVENARIAVTYRQNIAREWLFFEITPEYSWTKEVDEERLDQVVITFRVEVMFQNI